MKQLYGSAVAGSYAAAAPAVAFADPLTHAMLASSPPDDPETAGFPECQSARIATYDQSVSAPRIVDVSAEDCAQFIEVLSERVYSLAREAGGSIPYSVIRELAENLLHADFREPVVSILDHGRTIRFSDQGPGIADKDRALLPGFTTASASAKRLIRGVGSGLPIVKDYLYLSGGSLQIEDNLGGGAVLTIRSGSAAREAGVATMPSRGTTYERSPDETVGVALSHSAPMVEESTAAGAATRDEELPPAALLAPPRRLSVRQKQVLAIVAESGSAGPSAVAKELGVGVSTAYRDLALLEDRGLLSQADSGKRVVTDGGLEALRGFMHG